MIVTQIDVEYDHNRGRNITLKLHDYNGSAPDLSYMVGRDVDVTFRDNRNTNMPYDSYMRTPDPMLTEIPFKLEYPYPLKPVKIEPKELSKIPNVDNSITILDL